ncbi:YceD family protein [Endomicrobium proavitum]|uniref:DUF177 domain-containing protein n=1 Tax=Endomicrobium proavitum TaxID=1408281 RepID=A0A0G3WIM0_9BACT|nr:DUF177 domain-containing protein [Endomicrobium proavitum]AKL97727.1 hypothetical protein Epro_0348 [Endomicrobium proavitum]
MKQFQINISEFSSPDDIVEKKVDNFSIEGLPNKLSADIKAVKIIGDNRAYVSGTVKGYGELECSRCLEIYKHPIDLKIASDIVFDEGVADVGEEIRQLVILEMPSRPLCSDKCLGICKVCGRINKENDSCSCDKEDKSIKETWAGLLENARNKNKKS